MKNISLIKISSIVAIAALASNFVNANDEVLDTPVTPVQVSFSSLVGDLDKDGNGFLEHSEVLDSDNETLKEMFSKIDLNSDSKIGEDEFNNYLL